ncbi:FUSC family protein [Planctomonas sp. JC2975]|nr:FUSC family protein [Planctomonas sp. JC2975]NNC13490.1 FUSC family protein [Planctomonas sp. JC2975]
MHRRRVSDWLNRHDPDLAALRRAGRTAIVMPLLFAFGYYVVGNADYATFCAFGSFAMLLLVGFGGTIRERLQAQLALAVTGGVLVVLGTLTATPVWLGALSMAVVAFAVLFVGTVSSVLASASTSLLIAFILPVTLPGGLASVLPRLAGWGTASVVGLAAIALLWPAPVRLPLRTSAAHACLALATRLRADAAFVLSGREPSAEAARDAAAAQANDAVAALRALFLATPYRPTGLSTPDRTVVRLVDEISWLQVIAAQSAFIRRPVYPASDSVYREACDAKIAGADALERGADILMADGAQTTELEAAIGRLARARSTLASRTMTHLPNAADRTSAETKRPSVDAFVSALDPAFRAQELSYAVSQVAGNIVLTAEAERRSWWDKALGRQPGDLRGAFGAGLERAGAQFRWRSVWLHNSLRGAAALGVAVLLADLTGVQHSFWVVLGTLSVLRSNALSTGQNVLRGVIGTSVGVIAGALLLALIGDDTVALWILLPIAILVAGFAPTAISFAAGQAGFTIILVLLFNIIEPTGWTVGLVRIEDVALGCLVSLAVGLLFWPRGAAAALRAALADAYSALADYLAAAVAFGVDRCDATTSSRQEPTAESRRAAAASRRLDDTFRTYLTEHSPRRVPLSVAASSVAGVAGIRLISDAIVDMWRDERGETQGDRARARRALQSSVDLLCDWCVRFGMQLVDRAELPQPLPRDPRLAAELLDAVRLDLIDETGMSTPTAVRLVWTGDYLDAVRRLQAQVVGSSEPTRAGAGVGVPTDGRPEPG